jgi:hypothetical protein
MGYSGPMPRAWTLLRTSQYKPYTMLFPALCRKGRHAASCLNGLILPVEAGSLSQAAAQRQITSFCASDDVVRAGNHLNRARFTVNANPR